MKNKRKTSLPGKTKAYNEIVSLPSSNLLLTARLCSNYQTVNKATNISLYLVTVCSYLSKVNSIKGAYNYAA